MKDESINLSNIVKEHNLNRQKLLTQNGILYLEFPIKFPNHFFSNQRKIEKRFNTNNGKFYK